MRNRANTSFTQMAAGVVFVTLSGVAAAQSAVPSTNPSTNPSATPYSGSSVHLYESAATQLISTTSLQQMLAISNALGANNALRQGPPGAVADSGQRVGMAAGGMNGKLNVWGNLSRNNNEYKTSVSRFSADSDNTVLGADFALTPTLVAGLSAAFDHITGSNGLAGQTKYKSTGYSLAPYVGWQINKDWSLDGILGWGSGEFKPSNTSANTDADRLFYGTNLNYTRWLGNWQFSGRGSYLYGEEKYDNTKVGGATIAGTSTKNKVEQWRLAGQAAYWLNGVMPYVGIAYSTDTRTTANPGAQTTNDMGKDAWLWSLGVNFISVKNSLTGGVVYNRETGRSHSDRDSVMANLNYRF